MGKHLQAPRRCSVKRLAALVFPVALTAAALFGAGAAEAEVDICASLAVKPTTNTVEYLIYQLVSDGWTGYEAGEIIAYQVLEVCPDYVPVLLDFIDENTQPSTPVGGGIGGRFE